MKNKFLYCVNYETENVEKWNAKMKMGMLMPQSLLVTTLDKKLSVLSTCIVEYAKDYLRTRFFELHLLLMLIEKHYILYKLENYLCPPSPSAFSVFHFSPGWNWINTSCTVPTKNGTPDRVLVEGGRLISYYRTRNLDTGCNFHDEASSCSCTKINVEKWNAKMKMGMEIKMFWSNPVWPRELYDFLPTRSHVGFRKEERLEQRSRLSSHYMELQSCTVAI
ncbi:hypothetical protein DICVIV_10439 [Dictyocaulus viviparus]|uniref:Uncharacterized protein n=1 Tax=Dictyocaulus viviparus TaxID=29172 RepID=A0A0D8XIH4_DICVI|nr:hypothetical protein DICVIV_10439 [Dictyocaulus viviparus]